MIPKKSPKPKKPMRPRISTRQKVFKLHSEALVKLTREGAKEKPKDVYAYFLSALENILK